MELPLQLTEKHLTQDLANLCRYIVRAAASASHTTHAQRNAAELLVRIAHNISPAPEHLSWKAVEGAMDALSIEFVSWERESELNLQLAALSGTQWFIESTARDSTSGARRSAARRQFRDLLQDINRF